MCKAGRIVLMTAGLAVMCVILILFGFVETGIPPIVYLGIWGICAGAIYYGAGDTEEEKTGQTKNDIIISTSGCIERRGKDK